MSKIGNKKINRITNPENYKVGIYVRTGVFYKELDVVAFQKDRIEEFCEDLNLKIEKSYIDNGVDRVAESRPAYDELIQDIKDGKINMIVTANLPRIARSKKEMLELLELQKQYNFRTVFSDSREELYKDSSNFNLQDYIQEDDDAEELDEEYEEYEDDMFM